jgi:hypothetical protein
MLSQVNECPILWVRSRLEAKTRAGSGVVFPCGPRGGQPVHRQNVFCVVVVDAQQGLHLSAKDLLVGDEVYRL